MEIGTCEVYVKHAIDEAIMVEIPNDSDNGGAYGCDYEYIDEDYC